MNASLKKILLPAYYRVLHAGRTLGFIRKPEIKICIGTNRKYAAQTIPPLVASLIESGINANNVHVFEGGHETKHYSFSTFHHYLTDHNSIDFTALIEAAESTVKTDYWFFLHDTCLVGKMFKKLTENIPHFWPDAMPLKDYPSMSMGAYKANYLKSKKGILQSYRNCSNDEASLKHFKEKAIQDEDILFKQSKRPVVYNGWLLQAGNGYERKDVSIPSIYTNRICEYFPQVDLYKFKANYKPQEPRILEL